MVTSKRDRVKRIAELVEDEEGVSKADLQNMARNLLTLVNSANQKISGATQADKRELLTSLSAFRNQLGTLERSLKEMVASEKDTLSTDLETLRGDIETEIEDLRDTLERFASFADHLTEMKNHMRLMPQEMRGEFSGRLDDYVKAHSQVHEDLDKKLKALDERITRIASSRGGARKTTYVKSVNLSSQLNGVTKSFTLPKDTIKVLGVWGTQFPITFNENVDWTFAGNNLTLTSEVTAPETGQTLFCLVETLFYG